MRIVSMLLIVASHFACHGTQQVLWPHVSTYGLWREAPFFNRLFLSFLNQGGTVGVGIFFMLTGYFMAQKKASPVKLARLLLQMFFYAAFVFISFLAAARFSSYPFEEFNSSLIKVALTMIEQCVIPITSGAWWFASAYFFLYILSPVLNYVALSLNRRGFRLLLALVFVFWYLPCVLGFNYSGLQRGIFFYLLGVYARLFSAQIEAPSVAPLQVEPAELAEAADDSRKEKKKTGKSAYLFAGVFFYLALAALGFASNEFFTSDSLKDKLAKVFFNGMHYAIVPLVVCFLFAFFSRVRLQSRFVNALASCTFGVYLLHDSMFGRVFIWNCIVRPLDRIASPFFFAFALASIAAVFFACAAFDRLRMRFVEKPLLPKIDALAAKFRARFFADSAA